MCSRRLETVPGGNDDRNGHTQFYRADSMEFGFIGYYLVHNIGTYRIGFTTTDFFNIIITFFFFFMPSR